MNYFRSTDYPDGCYVVGDIHGDITVFLETGILSGTFGNALNSAEETQMDLVHWKEDKKALLIFLGDVVDSLRPHGPKGFMDPKSDEVIIETILRLRAEALRAGGNIVFIVGNHELGHITNDISCQKFSHAGNCTTRKDEFKKKVTAWMIDRLKQLKSVSVCMVDNTLLCHGGVPTGLKPITVSSINRQYKKFLETAGGPVSDDAIFYKLAWHRPRSYIQQDIQQITYMKKKPNALVVGHSPVSAPSQLENSAVRINRTGKNEAVHSSQHSTENQLVSLDFAMSRAFNTGTEPKKEEFCLLGVAQLLKDNQIKFIYKTHTRCRLDPSRPKQKLNVDRD
jgi:hypothetical protein